MSINKSRDNKIIAKNDISSGSIIEPQDNPLRR